MTMADVPHPTQEVQADDDALAARFSDNALQILTKRYLRKDSQGNAVETVAGMFTRIAHHIAVVEEQWTATQAKLKLSSMTCSPTCALCQTRRPSPVLVRLSGSWRRVSCSRLRTTWGATPAGSSRRFAMLR